MIKLIKSAQAREYITFMKQRIASDSRNIFAQAQAIINEVKQNGYDAVCKYSQKFDGLAPYQVAQTELKAAYDRIDPALRSALEKAANNIKIYHEKIKVDSWSFKTDTGMTLGQKVTPLQRVGIYVPGGTAAYPSSVLMSGVIARVAGVDQVVMVTPPNQNLSDNVLAAAYIAQVDMVFALGGVQAVAALAFGAGDIPQVDKIVGPGNAYVTAAKKIVFGEVDIDMLAGPSEVLIIADGTANPEYIAADLLSQAEHDKLAASVLLTDDPQIAQDTISQLKKQLEQLPRKEIAQSSIDNYGCIIVCDSIKQACEISNQIAPEHLEILTKAPEQTANGITNAGAMFLGEFSPEPLGDYMAGPSHILPTSGTARFHSPLSTESFVKKTSIINASRESLAALYKDIDTIATAEGLQAHARSILKRFE